jgi:Ni/Fe-hydrogenase subunit HybB-like protein
MKTLNYFWHFVKGSLSVVSHGTRAYYAWIALLVVVILIGVSAYMNQVSTGLITANMRDPLSWGFYIGNFAFLVGVAAAAVVLVVPAYVYNWGPLRDVVLIAELLSVAAIVMCILFVTVDVGRPEFLWHLAPGVGTPNFPHSMLVWDILVLNAYFLINYFIVTYLLFMGLKARAFWHTAILAPRFLSSAFCAGPALLLLIFQILRRVGKIKIPNEALFKIGELIAYAMAVNLFFLGVEVFTEFYGATAHSVHARFQWFGIHGSSDVAVWTWLALACNSLAFVGFMVPSLRYRLPILSTAGLLAIIGVYIEKGMGLLLPGMTPGVLGEVYHYQPSLNEVMVSAGIWGIGALLFTLMVKVAMEITVGRMRYE